MVKTFWQCSVRSISVVFPGICLKSCCIWLNHPLLKCKMCYLQATVAWSCWICVECFVCNSWIYLVICTRVVREASQWKLPPGQTLPAGTSCHCLLFVYTFNYYYYYYYYYYYCSYSFLWQTNNTLWSIYPLLHNTTLTIKIKDVVFALLMLFYFIY